MFSAVVRRPFQGAVAAGDAAANILASVPWVAQWKFNNNGNDSVGANNLTNNNSATFTTGLLGGATGATQLVAASSQYWSIADNAALSMGDIDFTLCAWVYFDTKSAPMAIVSKWDGGSSKEYLIYYNSASDRIDLYISSNGSAQDNVTATSFGAVPTATWLCVMAWHDAANNTINIQVNNGAVNSKAYTTGCFAGSAQLDMGRAVVGSYLNGRLDNICIAKSAAGGGGVLTVAQRTAFYNAGAGTETIT